jgi:hypothetical protein
MNCRYLFTALIAISVSLQAQIPGNEHWDIRFGPSGTESMIITVMKHGKDVYIGGSFGMAGSANATNIARWDGIDEWHQVGPGLGRTEGSLLMQRPCQESDCVCMRHRT